MFWLSKEIAPNPKSFRMSVRLGEMEGGVAQNAKAGSDFASECAGISTTIAIRPSEGSVSKPV